MTTYRLPDGAERESADRHQVYGIGITLIGFNIDGAMQWFPLSLLIEVKPPAEPGPGAYLIGELLAVRFKSSPKPVVDGGMRWRWECAKEDDGWDFGEWEVLWKAIGGPDVTITPLVPSVPVEPVELPWVRGPIGREVAVHPPLPNGDVPVVIATRVGDAVAVHLDRAAARSMAAALLSAADRSDQ